jgi:DNA-binding NtrC family response regulator
MGSAAGQTIASAPAVPRVLSQSARTILLVEDNASLRGLAAEVLRACGYEVVECDSGDAAITAAQSYLSIDLLISDVALRGMTGLVLAAAIAGSRPDMPVLYISGYPDESVTDARPGIKSQFLQKPFGAGTLISTVRSLLGE